MFTTYSHPKARNTDKKWAYNIENKFLGEKLPEGSANSNQHHQKSKVNENLRKQKLETSSCQGSRV